MNYLNSKLCIATCGLLLTGNVFAAAPSFSITPAAQNVAPGSTVTVNVNYDGDGSGAFGVGFNLTLDTTNVQAGSVSVTCDSAFFGLTAATCTNWTETSQGGQIGATYLPAQEVPTTNNIMTITFTVAGGASVGDTISISTSNHEYADSAGVPNIADGGSTNSLLTIANAPAFSTTVNYSIDPAGTGTGTFICDSGASGATVAGGTAVSCTAAPNGTDTSAITGCPAGATTSTDTTCAFTASSTANETVDLVAQFNTAGSGPGGPNNPTTPGGAARPVPALGVFGLLAMLASMFGAATLVLRRKR